MKKIVICFLVLAVIFTASVSAQRNRVDELDSSIRGASDYLNDMLTARSKIVILNIQSPASGLSDYIIDGLITNTVNDRIFTVVTRAQLDLIRAELDFQWSGEVDERTAQEIGKFFGAQSIVSGNVVQIGKEHRFTITALDVETAEIQGQKQFSIKSSKTLDALKKGR